MARDIRELKLPKWVQEELRDLRAELRDMERKCSILEGKNTGTGLVTAQVSVVNISEKIALPDNCNIAFGEKHKRIRLNYIDDYLRVYSDGTLNVNPRAANCIWLRAS